MTYHEQVFGGYTTEDLVWGHDGGKPGADCPAPDEFHIIGPRMPRIAPVSPTNIAPCGYALSSDAMRRPVTHTPDAFPETPKCRFCTTFAEQLTWAERDAKRQLTKR